MGGIILKWQGGLDIPLQTIFILVSSTNRQLQFYYSIASPYYIYKTTIQSVHIALSRVILVPYSYGPESPSGYITPCLKKPPISTVFQIYLILFQCLSCLAMHSLLIALPSSKYRFIDRPFQERCGIAHACTHTYAKVTRCVINSTCK